MSDPRPLRAYRALLRMYPKQFRDEYSTAMVDLVREQVADETGCRVYGRAVLDLLLTVPTQRLEARMNRPPTLAVALAYAALGIAGVALAIAGGTNRVTLAAGLLIGAIGALLATAALRRATPSRGRDATRSWWIFLLAGPALIAAVVAAAGLGVEAWTLGMVCVFAAFALTATGVLLGVVRLASHRRPAVPT